MAEAEADRLEKVLLLHLLEHRGQQVRFEASPWTTEFGIFRRFTDEPPSVLRNALRSLEMARMVYLRTQYVVGYSEPKLVYSLTPTGHRKAVEYQHDGTASERGRSARAAPGGGSSPRGSGPRPAAPDPSA